MSRKTTPPRLAAGEEPDVARTKRQFDRSKGYSRSQYKAVTQAVLGDHLDAEWSAGEDLAEDGTFWSLFAVSAEEVAHARAAQEPDPVVDDEPVPAKVEAPPEPAPVEKPPRMLDRALMALRFARS